MTIQQKQCLLCHLGLYSGAIDGIWGPKSAKAEAQFRQNQGLSPTEALESALLDAIRPEQNHWWDTVPHFRKEEFVCKCGQFCDGYPAEPDKILVEAAEKVRNHFAAPVLISSGLRCQTHNKKKCRRVSQKPPFIRKSHGFPRPGKNFPGSAVLRQNSPGNPLLLRHNRPICPHGRELTIQ